jgi:hypothetical protein
MNFPTKALVLTLLSGSPMLLAQPTIALVANAEGENPVIAPNTWVEVKGANLSKAGDSRAWAGVRLREWPDAREARPR